MTEILEELNGPYTPGPFEGMNLTELSLEEVEKLWRKWQGELVALGHTQKEAEELRPLEAFYEFVRLMSEPEGDGQTLK